MSRAYAKIHPKIINGRRRNDPIPMEQGELEAMASSLRSGRRTDGLSGKERRAAYVRERAVFQDPERHDGGEV